MDSNIVKLVLLLLFLTLISEISARKRQRNCVRKQWTGCKVRRNGRCVCGVVSKCKNPYVYPNKRVCRQLNRNVCKVARPCQNGGTCQNVGKREYKCQCSQTGFYGTNCEQVCPTPDRRSSQYWRYPPECIVI